jgi:hypothetical protein
MTDRSWPVHKSATGELTFVSDWLWPTRGLGTTDQDGQCGVPSVRLLRAA